MPGYGASSQSDGNSLEVTSGDDRGTNGPPFAALAFTTLGLLIAAAINVSTRVHDQPGLSAPDKWWEPIVWEGSSTLASLVLIPLVWRSVVSIERRASSLPAAITISIAYSLAFFVLHVATFVLLRWGAYAAVGGIYVFGDAGAWLYELPKDLVTFIIVASILLAGKRLARQSVSPIEHASFFEPVRIKDGNRTFLVMPDEILAANASGNYVEYRLADGRRPLARGKFSEAQALLSPYGFVRTHRSWLVNHGHIREVNAQGNGNHELVVGTDLLVPVSRRFAAELLKVTGQVPLP